MARYGSGDYPAGYESGCGPGWSNSHMCSNDTGGGLDFTAIDWSGLAYNIAHWFVVDALPFLGYWIGGAVALVAAAVILLHASEDIARTRRAWVTNRNHRYSRSGRSARKEFRKASRFALWAIPLSGVGLYVYGSFIVAMAQWFVTVGHVGLLALALACVLAAATPLLAAAKTIVTWKAYPNHIWSVGFVGAAVFAIVGWLACLAYGWPWAFDMQRYLLLGEATTGYPSVTSFVSFMSWVVTIVLFVGWIFSSEEVEPAYGR